MNPHQRHARTLTAGAICFALAGAAIATWSTATFGLEDGGYMLPVVFFVFGAVALAWTADHERALGHRTTEETAHAHTDPSETPQPLAPCCARTPRPTQDGPRGHRSLGDTERT
ncbi:hypothetical protein ACIQZB_00520 [Streptomyces sp. NPDC097727]|uniref:hypothetical protein n=1 Tax=Streptomyces sp. NPDC097727 TaxID=3366092 RepID=UPI00380C788C